MKEDESETSNMMFEYVLRTDLQFFERLLKLGVSEEAQTEIEAMIGAIKATLGD